MDITRVLIDTSIILEYLRKKDKEQTVLYRLYQAYDEIFVSTITVFEIFVGINPKNQQIMAELFEGFNALSFDTDTAKIANRQHQQLKAQNKLIELRDLFIGATALAYNLPLATLNQEHFARLADVKMV